MVSMVFDSLTLNEWAVVIGMSATIFSFLINWYYKHQEVKIKNNH
ncbi:HP1 family phage holin [Frischella perrara]